jgi:hypothetical protein
MARWNRFLFASVLLLPAASFAQEPKVTCLDGHIYEFYLLGKEWPDASDYAKSLTRCGKKVGTFPRGREGCVCALPLPLSHESVYLNASLAQGHLVTVTSPAEQLYVENLLSSAEYTDKVWIGLTKKNKSKNKNLEWSTGEPVSFSNWADGEPDNLKKTDCGVMNPSLGGKWQDELCRAPKNDPLLFNVHFPFVVEYDCDSTVCSAATAVVPPEESNGSLCKGKDGRCWLDEDCCAGYVCKGTRFMYCKKP